MQKSYFNFEAGRLCCTPIREFLVQEQFLGRKIRFLESKGFLSRTFTISGDPIDLKYIYDRLEEYSKQLEANNGKV